MVIYINSIYLFIRKVQIMVSSTRIKFTDMEKKIINLLKLGDTNPEIAKKLNISRHTVKYYVSSILIKTEAVNRINAVFILTSKGYIKQIEEELAAEKILSGLGAH